MMKKQRITIAVTGLNNTDNPGPGVPVIRGIRASTDLDVRIIGLAYENLEPGIYMPGMTDKTYLIPYPSAGTKVFLNRILEIHALESIDVIIPNFDAELYTLSSLKNCWLNRVSRPFCPPLNNWRNAAKPICLRMVNGTVLLYPNRWKSQA